MALQINQRGPMTVDGIGQRTQFDPIAPPPRLSMTHGAGFNPLNPANPPQIPITTNLLMIPHATYTVESTVDADGDTANLQSGDFLFSKKDNNSDNVHLHDVMTPFTINRCLREQHNAQCDLLAGIDRDTLRAEIDDAVPVHVIEEEDRDGGSSRKRKRNVEFDVISGLMTTTIFDMAEFSRVMTYLGPIVSPENTRVMNANAHGKIIGHASHTLQAKGDAFVPNWWGEVQPGDNLGFVAMKCNPISLHGDQGLKATKQMRPIQIYPVVNWGRHTLYGRQPGVSTVAYRGSHPMAPGTLTPEELSQTFAERTIDTVSFDPFNFDPAFIDHTLQAVVGPGGVQRLYPIPEVSAGMHYHVGKVHRIHSAVPAVETIKTAFLGPDNGEAVRAQDKIKRENSLTILVTGPEARYTSEDNFRLGGIM